MFGNKGEIWYNNPKRFSNMTFQFQPPDEFHNVFTRKRGAISIGLILFIFAVVTVVLYFGAFCSNSLSVFAATLPAPTGLTATPLSQTQIYLSWNSVSGATAYYIYYVDGTIVGATSGTSYYHTLPCNTTASYYVKAYNSGGYSGSSGIVTATTDACTPGTPTNVSATCTGQTTASVSWTRNSPYSESGFQIFTSSGSQVGTASAGSTSGTASGLSANTPYSFYVRAYVTTNGRTYYSSNSATSNTCTTLPNPPAAPTGLTATPVSQSQINLSWNAVSGATLYYVYLNGVQIGSTSGTSFSHTGLSCGTNYSYYSVRAYNSGGYSDYSNNASATTDQCTPGAPSNVSAAATGQTTASVSWTRNSPYDETGFFISISYVGSWDAGAGATSGSITGLSCGTAYNGTVYSYVTTNGRTYYSPGTGFSVSTDACTPAAPSNFTATPISQTQINLAWTDNSTGESGFEIEECLSDCKSYSYLTSVGANVQSYSRGGLLCSYGVGHRVRAYVNTNGRTYYSGYSNGSFTSTDDCPPGTPTNVSATCTGQTTASVSWTRNSPYTESGFQIFTSSNSQVGTANAGSTSGTASGLSANTPYSFYVRAYVTTNGRTYYSGNSAISNTCTTLPNPPATPTGFVAGANSPTEIFLAWDSMAGATSYTLKRGSTTIYSGSGTSFHDTGLTCNTNYSYTVYASNAGGDSGTASVSATTLGCPPPAPTGLTANAVSQTQINLSWADNSPDESGFRVYESSTLIASLPANTTSYSVTGLSCNTNHSYSVVAYKTYCPSCPPKVQCVTSCYDVESTGTSASATTQSCDVTAPSISFNPSSHSWTNTSITVSVTIADPSTIGGSKYCWTTSSSCTPGTTLGWGGTSMGWDITSPDVQGEWKLCIWAQDSLGNAQTLCASPYQIDKTTPTTSDNSPGVTSSSPLDLRVYVGNRGPSSLDYIRWCMDQSGGVCNPVTQTCNGVPCSYGGTSGGLDYTNLGYPSNPFLNCASGTTCPVTTFKYYAYDDAGNVGSVNSGTFQIDREPPYFVPGTAPSFDAYPVSQSAIRAVIGPAADSGAGLHSAPYGFSTDDVNYTWSSSNSMDLPAGGAGCNTTVTTYGKVRDAVGNEFSMGAAVRTTDQCTPGTPTIGSASATGQTTATVTWARNAPTTESGFEIRSNDGVLRGTAGPGATSGTASGLTANTSYSFYVRAYVDTNGRKYYSDNSGISNTITTYPNPPAAPTGLTANAVSQTQINLSWTDNSTNESGFYIYRDGVNLTSVGPNVTSYSDTALSCGTNYTYYVVAYNDGGTSGNSNTVSVSTASCVSAPAGGPQTSSIVPDPGRPTIRETTVTVDADGWYALLCKNDDTGCKIIGYGVSNDRFAPLEMFQCPVSYKLYFYGYNVDNSLIGMDSSCNDMKTKLEANGQSTADLIKKKCSPSTVQPLKIDYCTKGFLVE